MLQEVKTFEETVTPYVEKILKGIETGVEFAQEEIPIILQQYVLYEAIMSWSFVLFSIIILIVGIISGNKLRKSEIDYEPLDYFCYIISTLVSFIMFFSNISEAIQATFFPKLFLVKEFLNHIN